VATFGQKSRAGYLSWHVGETKNLEEDERYLCDSPHNILRYVSVPEMATNQLRITSVKEYLNIQQEMSLFCAV
jgi:hypothetical protein